LRVLPLGLAGELERQLAEELLTVVPAHLLDRMETRDRSTLPAAVRRMVLGRVLAGDARPLRLRELELREEERCERDALRRRLVRLGERIVVRRARIGRLGAHREGP